MDSENIDLMYFDLCERLGVFIDDINSIINSYREFVELLIEHLHALASTFESCFEILKDMLKAAAMTYVAGVLSSAIEILRLILIFTDRD